MKFWINEDFRHGFYDHATTLVEAVEKFSDYAYSIEFTLAIGDSYELFTAQKEFQVKLFESDERFRFRYHEHTQTWQYLFDGSWHTLPMSDKQIEYFLFSSIQCTKKERLS